MGWVLKTKRLIWIVAVLGLLAGCAATDTAPEFKPLKASVEALYLNYWDLKGLHSDLRAAARLHIEASGAQLAEIQSAARFIRQANLIAYYQWELLSITAYIRDTARRDFFTLRARDLIDARDKSHDLILSVRIYEAFIRDRQALELIATCIQRIEKHMALYQQMAQELQRILGEPQTIETIHEQSRNATRPAFSADETNPAGAQKRAHVSMLGNRQSRRSI